MTHVVQQGEHISAIAARYGFKDYRNIWNDPTNASLTAARPNPHVLYPGDEIYIPDKQEHKESRPTGTNYVFQVTVPKLELRLRLLNLLGKPLKNTACELQVDGQSIPVMTDGDGRFTRQISVSAHDVKLLADSVEYNIRIGDLDPVDEEPGLFARLNNMGYYIGNPDDVDDDDLQFALSLFQLDSRLNVDGESAPAVLAKLEDAHGC